MWVSYLIGQGQLTIKVKVINVTKCVMLFYFIQLFRYFYIHIWSTWSTFDWNKLNQIL